MCLPSIPGPSEDPLAWTDTLCCPSGWKRCRYSPGTVHDPAACAADIARNLAPIAAVVANNGGVFPTMGHGCVGSSSEFLFGSVGVLLVLVRCFAV